MARPLALLVLDGNGTLGRASAAQRIHVAPSTDTVPWLDWFAGNVYTKHPDSALLRKMVRLAERLGARVQGDDGELYTGDEPLDDYLDAAAAVPGPPASQRTSWWRRLTGR